MNDMLYKLLKETKPKEQEIQRKGLSPSFISLFIKLILSIPAAGMFSFLALVIFSIDLPVFFLLTLVFILPLIPMMFSSKITRTRMKRSTVTVFWIFFLVAVAFPFSFLMCFSMYDNTGWSLLFLALTFTLILTLIMLLFAFYKISGIDEGWTMDRATSTEKIAVALWIFSLAIPAFFILVYLLDVLNNPSFKATMFSLGLASIPLAITLLVVFLVNVMSIRKNRLSKIKELAMKEARENKD